MKRCQPMKAQLTALTESAPEGGYWAVCPEVPGANGQGETVDDAKASLAEAVRLIIDERIADMRRGMGSDAIEDFLESG